MRAYWGVIALALALALAACGSDVDIDTNADNVCNEMAEVACHNMYNCCSAGEIQELLNVGEPRTQAECQEDVRRLCERSVAPLDFAIAQQRVRFEADVMNHCLESLVAPSGTCASVETSLPWAEACMNSAWVGLVADGGACLSSIECAGEDSFCAPNQLCTARPSAGQQCGQFGCASDSYCDFNTCRLRARDGEPCAFNGECEQGLFCDFAAAPAARCAAPRAIGEACSGNASCQSNRCTPGICAGALQLCFNDSQCGGTCEDDNSPCTTDANCGFGQCSISLFTCASTAQCADPNDVCLFPVRCNVGRCTGDIVCADNYQVVDYCEDALEALPLPGSGAGPGAPIDA